MSEGFIIRRGGGGGSLNFKIVGGTAEPTNPIENTIWVNTDTPIVGYHLSTVQPDDVLSGDVWIQTVTSGAIGFNALKENRIQIYPLVAKQYISGVWIKKEMTCYLGGEWVTASKYLLDGSSDTGIAWNTYGAYKGTAAEESTGYKITGSNGGNQPGAIQTSEKVDISGFSKLHFIGSNDNAMSANFPLVVGIQNSKSYQTSNYDGIYVISRDSVASTSYSLAGTFDLIVDISQCSGSYYIGASSGHESTHIYQIWLEV